MDRQTEQQIQKAAFDAELDKEYPVILKKREMIVIFNLLTTLNMKYGDFIVVKPIIDKLEPIVAVASNIPQKNNVSQGPILTGTMPKEENVN